MCCPWLCLHCGWLYLKCSRNQLRNCTHFRHPTDEQLRHVDIFFSNYYNLQSVHVESFSPLVLCARVLEISLWPKKPARPAKAVACSSPLDIETSLPASHVRRNYNAVSEGQKNRARRFQHGGHFVFILAKLFNPSPQPLTLPDGGQ